MHLAKRCERNRILIVNLTHLSVAQVWADKDYKKAHLGTRWKANPFGGASHAKGIVLEKVTLPFFVIL
jgi:hypothetical protein